MKYLAYILLTFIVVLPISALPIPETEELCPMGMTMTEMAAMQDPPSQTPPTQEQPQDPNDPNYEGNPTHESPSDYCTPNRELHPCLCLRLAPEGCREGKRETEHRSCNSWCYKQFCRCCSS